MKLNSTQYENIEFRKKTLHDKLAQLERLISGRESDITTYIRTEKGTYSETSVNHFLKEMMAALNDYMSEQKPELKDQVLDEWKECVECFLYCTIRVMGSDLTWTEEWTSHFPNTNFNQILEFSKELDTGKKRYYVLFAELYYGRYGQVYEELERKEFFWYCTWMYEELTKKEITDTISASLKEKTANVYASEIKAKRIIDTTEDDFAQEIEEEMVEYPDVDDIEYELSEEILKDIEESEIYYKELQNKLERWKKDFKHPEIFCEKYLRFRELYFEGMIEKCGNFATLIEGMLDTYLYQKGLPGYADEDFFITTFTHLRKTTNQIIKLKEED